MSGSLDRRVDLHSHSWCSDGTLSPEALVDLAVSRGVQVLALTDHDTTEGVAAAQQASAGTGLVLVPGVEISVTWERRTLHVVGLDIDPGAPELQAGLARLRGIRGRRARDISERLAESGVEGAADGVRALARGAILSRTHFARYLVDQGHVRTLQQAFKRYLSVDCKAYVPARWAALDEAVAWIHGAGGRAVLAHPGRYKLGRTRMRRMLAAFRACGGDAIEIHSGSQRPEDSRLFAGLAREFGLLASVGSDYHGPEQRWLDLGGLPRLPAGCVPVWGDWSH